MLQKPIDVGDGYSPPADEGISEAESAAGYEGYEKLFDKLVERIRPVVAQIAVPKLEKLWKDLQEKEIKKNRKSKS